MAVQKKTTPPSKFNGKLSLIIPCYNEEQRLQEMIDGLQEFGKKCFFDYEIIVVDDGSTDNTSKVILSSDFFKELESSGKFKLIQLPANQGKGFALKTGVAAASGTHILTLDADMSTRPVEVLKWVASNNNQFPSKEIWIASREHHDSKITEIPSRRRTGRVFNLCVRFFTPLKLRDTQCGFKLYPSPIAKEIFAQQKSTGWAHDVELLYHAQLRGITIKDLPVTWVTKPGSKISPAKDWFPMLVSVIIVSVRLHWEWFIGAPLKMLSDKNYAASFSPDQKNDSLFRMLFFVSAVVLFFLMASLSLHYGITGDDLDQKVYGEKVLNFYTSFGRDTSCLHLKIGNKENLYIYGGLFNMISAAANRYVGGLDEYDMRHLINAIAGFLTIMFAGLLARKLGNWMTGFLAFVLLATWPQFFGQSMNNPKDIPFALGYVFTIYYLMKLVIELPRPSVRTWMMTAIGIAFTINIRVGGLLLIGMLFAFVIGAYILSPEKRKKISESKSVGYLFRRMLLVSAAGYFGGLLFWPYGLLGPLSNPFSALKEMSNFSMGIGVLFNGSLLSSKEIPWTYIPQWLWITTPLVVLFAAVAFAVIWYAARKKFSTTLSLLLIFATVFPWAYTVYQNSPLYDGMRQMLFIVPLIAVMAALSWHYVITLPKEKTMRYVVAVVMVIGIASPLRFSFANHPNEYCYFNELIGGIKGAYGKYDTDYYMNSIRKTSEWFKQSSMFTNANSQHKVVLATNTIDPVNWYFRNDTSKVKLVYTKWDASGNPKTRSARDWDYGIFFSRSIDPSMLMNGTFPSQKAIYQNSADDVPLSVVVERKDKSDLLGYQAMQKDSLLQAEKYFQQALKYNPQNEEVALWLAKTDLKLHKYDDAFKNLNLAVQLYPTNPETCYYLAELYQQQGNTAMAEKYMNLVKQYQQQ